MDRQAMIRQRLKEMAAEVGPDCSILAQVKSVNEDEFTCDLYDDDSGLDFFDVRLRPVIDGKEFITIIPKVDSWVLAVRIEDSDDWVVVSIGEAEKITTTIDTMIIEQNANGLLVKKADDTLKDALTLIVEAVQKIVVIQGTNPDQAKLSQALVKINNLLR